MLRCYGDMPTKVMLSTWCYVSFFEKMPLFPANHGRSSWKALHTHHIDTLAQHKVLYEWINAEAGLVLHRKSNGTWILQFLDMTMWGLWVVASIGHACDVPIFPSDVVFLWSACEASVWVLLVFSSSWPELWDDIVTCSRPKALIDIIRATNGGTRLYQMCRWALISTGR